MSAGVPNRGSSPELCSSPELAGSPVQRREVSTLEILFQRVRDAQQKVLDFTEVAEHNARHFEVLRSAPQKIEILEAEEKELDEKLSALDLQLKTLQREVEACKKRKVEVGEEKTEVTKSLDTFSTAIDKRAELEDILRVARQELNEHLDAKVKDLDSIVPLAGFKRDRNER